MMLQQIINRLYELPVEKIDRDDGLNAVQQLRSFLNAGEIRAAEFRGNRWHVNDWVKKGIILAFRLGVLYEYSPNELFQYFDKDTLSLKKVTLKDNIRIVPGGSAIRDGAYIAPGVIIMPPSYINIGVYIDEQTMIDSHVLVGSCAQIGKRVHISAGAQIGGVLEPARAMPVIVEDDVLIGGNCGIYEGTIVKKKAVIGAGVILTSSTPIYDVVKKKVYRKNSDEEPLVIPENAVVVAGTRKIDQAFAEDNNLSVYTPLIIKYRDDKTDLNTMLEEALR